MKGGLSKVSPSTKEIKNIKKESEVLETEVKKQDDIIQINELTAAAAGKHAAPTLTMEKTLKFILGTIVGMTIATTIVQDMYKLGAHLACHKWGKKTS